MGAATAPVVPFDQVLKSLADPVRLSIVRQLLACDGEKACGSFEYDITKATFSHHLAILEEAGIVRARPEGTRKLISLRRKELEARYPGLLALVESAE